MGWALMLDTLRNWCIAVQDPISDNLQFGLFADKACAVLGSIMVLPAPPPPEVLPSTVWGSFADRFAFQWKTPDSTTLTTTLTEEFENSVWTSLISGYPMVAGRAVTWWVLEHLLWIWWMVTDSLMNVVLGRVAWGHTKFVVSNLLCTRDVLCYPHMGTQHDPRHSFPLPLVVSVSRKLLVGRP